jgi:YbgC/YbaW family acyl-CoA thioester hydrolase
MGISHAHMMKEKGEMFVVRSCTLNCLASSRLDDVLEVRTFIKKVGHAKLEMSQAILREDHLIATLEVVLACINSLGKPIKIGESLRDLLLTYGSDLER